MALKISLKYFLAIVILTTTATNSLAATSQNTSDTIIINTVAQHYENPTLEQYNLCTRNRNKCRSDCLFDVTCKEKCQICPILIDQDILVQGINDTLHRMPITTSKVNQTNIIRLTNEIRNIIRTSLGNITAHNTNNITVFRKTSKTGGKFGLGYTEKGPCCHFIEPQKCKPSYNGPVCLQRRQLTCGSYCISKVMRAKKIVTCSDTNPDNCTQSIEYLPQLRHPGCVYTSKWPFISCKSSGGLSSSSMHRGRTTCARCFQIPYLYIIRGQVPKACLQCFGRPSYRNIPSFSYPTQPYGYGQISPIVSYPPYHPYSYIQTQPTPPHHIPTYHDDTIIENNVEYDTNDSAVELEGGFKLEEKKCVNEDGTVIENCTEEESPMRVNFETNVNDENADQNFVSSGTDYDFEEEEIAAETTLRRRRHH